MKFVHIADMHFDIPFKTLTIKADLGEQRRLEQRKVFKKVIDYIKQNNIEYLFIAGDLYEHEYINKSTIQFINDLFKTIPNTKILITPGNHDPFLVNSFYSKFNWEDNVKIFKSNVERLTFGNIQIYGQGFENFSLKSEQIENIKIEDKSKINILITHADLDGKKEEKGFVYNPINKRKLKEIGFDYIALGHIHKNNIEESENIIYPGSTISLGFDELGEHGMVVGNIDEQTKKLEINFVKLDDEEFVEENIDVSEIYSKELLIEKINDLKLNDNNYYKIVLVGKRKFEIVVSEIEKYIDRKNIIKIKDKSSLSYDLEEIAKEMSLKGLFVQEMLEKMKDEDADKEKIEKAIEIGMEYLN